MLSETPSITLWLQLTGPDFPDGRVPIDLYNRTLTALQKALWEAAALSEGDDFKPTAAFKRRYELHAVPAFAGPDGLPLAVGPMQLTLDLLTGSEPDAVLERLETALTGVESGDFASLATGRGRKLASELTRALPGRRERWTLGLTFRSGERLALTGRHGQGLSEWLDSRSRRQSLTMSVIGELVGVDFDKGTFELQLPGVKRSLAGVYDKSLEVWLLKHRRKPIQVAGTFLVDAAGRPTALKHVLGVTAVELSPIVLSRFEHRGRWFELIPSLTLTPELLPPHRQVFSVSEPGLGLEVTAETRDALETAVLDEVVALWDRHAQGGEDAFLAKAWRRRMKALAAAVVDDGY